MATLDPVVMLRLLPVFACALGLLVVFAEPLSSGLARQTSDGLDPRFTEFLFEHSWKWLRGETVRGLFDLPIAYPLDNTLAYAEPMFSFSIFYWPLRALGFSSGDSHQLWLILLGAINFACFFAFTRRGLGFGTVAATASSMLFTFGLPRVAEVGHSQLWAQPFVVCVTWGVFELLSKSAEVRERRLAVIAVCAGFVLQTWGSLYNAVFLVYACVGTGVFAFAYPAWRVHAIQTVREVGTFAAISLAVSLLCVLPVLMAAFVVDQSTADWRPGELARLQPGLGSMLHVWPHSWFYGWLTTATSSGDTEAGYQQALGLGGLTTCIVLYTLARHRKSPWVHLMATLVVALWLPIVMWPGGWTAWDYVREWLPGLASLRAIGRFGLLLLVPASIALGLFLEQRRTPRGRVACLVLGTLCIVEQGTRVPSYNRPPYDQIVRNVVAEIDLEAEAFYYVGAGVVPYWYSQLDAMLAAQRSGVPTVNMYSGRYPTDYKGLHRNISRDPRRLAQLRAAVDVWAQKHGLDPARIQLIDQNEIRARRGREFESWRRRGSRTEVDG